MTDPTPSRVLYENPPVVEAICQVTFDGAVPWSVATPGVLYKALEDEYPAEPTAMGGVRTNINAAEGEIHLNPQAARYVFSNHGRTRRLVANSTCLSVNALPPYEEWPSVVARFRRALEAFSSAVSQFTPAQVSLRYINRVVVPASEINLSDYFRIPVIESHQKNAFLQGFIARSQSALPSQSAQLTITFGSNDQAAAEECAFLLDIEVSAPVPHDATTDALIEKMGALHTIENVEFESSITDECRRLFN